MLKELLAQAKVDVQNFMDKITTAEAQFDIELKAAHDAGFDEGVLQTGPTAGTDKIFSLEEMNAEIAPRDAKIKELEAKVADLQVVIDGIPQQITDAKAELIVKFKAIVEKQKTAEDLTETELMTEVEALV